MVSIPIYWYLSFNWFRLHFQSQLWCACTCFKVVAAISQTMVMVGPAAISGGWRNVGAALYLQLLPPKPLSFVFLLCCSQNCVE